MVKRKIQVNKIRLPPDLFRKNLLLQFWHSREEKQSARVTCVRRQYSHFREKTLPWVNAGATLQSNRMPLSVFIMSLEAVKKYVFQGADGQ